MKIRGKFLVEALGSQPNNKEIQTEFIGNKSKDADKIAEETAALPVEEALEKSQTVFYRTDGALALADYQVKGFFKEACSMLSRVPKTASCELRAFKKVIDGLIFVTPRFIKLKTEDGTPVVAPSGNCQRPLRGQTAQGERISLANSEVVPAGTTFECEITCLDKRHEKLVEEWLNYGKLKGLLQWRNSGRGVFSWERLD